MRIPAIVTAGDVRAARSVYGQSKVYLDVAGRPLVARVVSALQRVPEVSAVWVVGDPKRLEAVFSRPDTRSELVKPLHVVPQFRHLYENCWEAYRRVLPGAGPTGRDPEGADRDVQPLFLSGDLPFATPQEISSFIRQAQSLDCDFAVGLVSDAALEVFLPAKAGGPGIRPAYFNIREGRLRQSNMHLVRPGRIGNRRYIEEMYDHRHQRELRDMLGLAWEILRSRSGGLPALCFFALIHLTGLADRVGLRGLARLARRFIDLRRVEAIISRLLDTRFRFVTTEVGGCAIDIDTEREYDAVQARFEEWSQGQADRARALHGPLPLASVAGEVAK